MKTVPPAGGDFSRSLMARRDRRLARFVREVRSLHADGFTVGVLVDIAMADCADRDMDDSERSMVRKMYVETLPASLRPKGTL